MKIVILAEPRSGSTNLGKWFKLNKEFTVLLEPYNRNAFDYKKDSPVHDWEYNTKHLLIKEIYTPDKDFKSLIKFSDKIIVLYRENKEEQFESWLAANYTNNWTEEWYTNQVKHTDNSRKDYFYNLVSGFKSNYILNENYFQMSYEELYYSNGLQRIVNYLNLDCVKNENFPYGKKYRIDLVRSKLI
jgi:hypothetical protein